MAHYKGAASEAGRALQLMKKREKAKEELELRKKKIELENKIANIGNKFAAHYDAVEQHLKSSTIGLVTLDEMRARQENVVKERERQLAKKQQEKEMQREKTKKVKDSEKKKLQKNTLSFSMDDGDDDEEEEAEETDEEDDNNGEEQQEQQEVEVNNEDTQDSIEYKESDDDDEPFTKKKKIGKNPDVDTSFLPDREREEEENRLREELRQEWVQKQEKLKNEEIEITFSYWDGSGHRRQVRMKKGNSIQQFLQRCLEMLRKDFNELRAVSVDQLMYVKEDLIIPHHYTFYDFIVTKARGKSGPLFNFDVHDDIRMVNDASIEKDESHAGKVVLRNWYERNKHIFPASRWEPYDPEKKWDKYTISDKNKP